MDHEPGNRTFNRTIHRKFSNDVRFANICNNNAYDGLDRLCTGICKSTTSNAGSVNPRIAFDR